ncbi:ATP-binding protein [Hydrogenimonas urashimensis]|uniref:ATP-binding protein n=1 Tax=Hydrogenimonas urashimensis TaxID=2740515 RepID=UPI001915EC0F|nr:ATP-binding protein [Hydrogenimonas urashimensis]
MRYLLEFLQKDRVAETEIFDALKCSEEEAEILRAMARRYVEGSEEVGVVELLSEMYGNEPYGYVLHLEKIRNLFELGWLMQNSFHAIKPGELSLLELLHANVSLSVSFLKLLENGNLDLVLPEVTPYTDHLEYLQDQFLRIDLYTKMGSARHSFNAASPGISRLQTKLSLLEKRIQERVAVTHEPIVVEEFFKEKDLDPKEQIIFLALLKEEYAGGEGNLRDMNTLIDLVSFDEYDRFKNRALLEEGARLVSEDIIDYDEMLNPFGGITRSFFINEEILHDIIHPQKKKKTTRLKLGQLVKEQDIFELIDPKTTLEDVVLNPQTREILESLLKQMDKKVAQRLKAWGIKTKARSIDARIIFYGPPGTGKTMTALSLAKSLKRQVLSFDCSKILSMYVGESEKNVRKIFDTFKELAAKSKSEPVLLLNEADQFLGSRSTGPGSSADKMHNQMQNIFLEQIEHFEGVLIATTNLLENLDTAFSRRFNYKIAFKKPNQSQRMALWKKMLPADAPYAGDFDIKRLAEYDLTGGQIDLVVKNTAYRVAVKEEPLFTTEDFIAEIKKEQGGSFEDEGKSMGFLA